MRKKDKSKSISVLTERLISDNEPAQQSTILNTIKEKVFKYVQTTNRTVYFNGQVEPPNNQTNLVKNTKYNIITFIPLVLFHQFKFFFNLFFLITALSQFIQALKVGLLITYIGPLAMVLTLTMIKQGYDDYRVYLRDIEANSQQYQVIKRQGLKKVKSKNLKVGDIALLQAGNRIPADMIVLYSQDEQGTLFIKTDQLDGQTDWKLRKAIRTTQYLFAQNHDYQSLRSSKLRIQANPPDQQIYKFNGVFTGDEGKQKITLENTMWASTVLTNGFAIGLVLYIGKQTRIAKGASTARTKVGILDLQINFLSKILFGLLVGLTIMLLILQGMELKYSLIQFTRIMILLSSIIPISMRVNLDFAKLFYAYSINKDKAIQGTITRNSNTPEQLGRVRYILSDKTGTLTQNQMLFKCLSIEDNIKYTEQQIEQIKEIISEYQNISEQYYAKQRFVKDLITALILCHNVTPVFSDDRLHKQFQASSPDQITFVKMAENFGITLQQRTQTSLTISIPSQNQRKKIKYQILYIFPFSSDTKRMGIILRNQTTQQIQFYLKGADAVMKNFITNKQKKGFIDQECKALSKIGLRTLVISKKKLSQQNYRQWSAKYEEQYTKLESNPATLARIMENLQKGVEFLGVTGIQDKLQENLKPVIQSLRSANIKIWMITGDKIQTAQCIGISCGLQKSIEKNYKIEQADRLPVWKMKWEGAKQNLSQILIIDGKTLTMVLKDEQISKDFFNYAMKMPAVICCRCSPQQKRLLTEGVKRFKGNKQAVLGIGDGGNDVGMIQAADIGIGIVGKQGNQAALAADFSILQFQYLKDLLLWHGRLSYKRSALLASFIIHRGFIVSMIQVIFSAIFFFISIQVFNSYLLFGYATIFTFWPVFSLILDADIDRKTALKFPILYSSLQYQNLLSWWNFMTWIWKASFQGIVIMILSFILFSDSSYLQIQTICFTVLIITQYCMNLSQLHQIHLLTLLFIGASVICYLFCILFFNSFIEVQKFTLLDIAFVLLITAISWGPLLLMNIIRKYFAPTDYEKITKHLKKQLISVQYIKRQSFVDSSNVEIRQ